jgi:hypothetical protein
MVRYWVLFTVLGSINACRGVPPAVLCARSETCETRLKQKANGQENKEEKKGTLSSCYTRNATPQKKDPNIGSTCPF